MTERINQEKHNKAVVNGSFPPAYSRRVFLTWLTGLSLGAAGFFTTAALVKFSQPPSRSLDGKIDLGWVRVAKEKDLIEGKPKLVDYGENRIYLVKTAGKVRAYNAACPHVACKVKWNEKTRSFNCPCHSSTFSMAGKRLGGPAPRDMFAMKMRIEGGEIWIGGTEDAEGRA